MKKIENWMSTLKPTSVENERAFSVSNNICTKSRNSLSDDSLDMLVHLKYFFIKKNQK